MTFVDDMATLREGDEVVVTHTGWVKRVYDDNSDYRQNSITVELANNDLLPVYNDEIASGCASVERIELKETKRLEPGVYETGRDSIMGRGFLIHLSDNDPMYFVGAEYPCRIDPKSVITDLERDVVRKVL